jgi:CheY-like chemotaxis protein
MKNVLIADDSETARTFIKFYLEVAGCRGCEFHEAADGERAWQMLQERPTELLVTDLNMPPKGGLALLEKLRADPKWKALPVMVVSSLIPADTQVRLQQLEVSAILEKPISVPKLTSALKSLGLVQGGAT